MAVPFSLKNTVVALYDADGGENVTLTAEDGDASVNGIEIPAIHILDRGDVGSVIEADHIDITMSMTLQAQAVTSSNEHIWDIITGNASGVGSWSTGAVDTASGRYASGGASELTTTNYTAPQVATTIPLFQMEWTITNPSTATTEKHIFCNCRAASGLSEGYPSKISLDIVCYGWGALAYYDNVS